MPSSLRQRDLAVRAITLSHSNIQKMLQEYAAIDMLSHQLEKVLDYYEEHPQYPLDFKKLRQTVMEVHARNAEAATTLRSAKNSESDPS
jgi:lipid A disaccharide synthetase